jgi:hypothetical protein
MRNKQHREEILLNHYKTWKDTTRNKYHKEYAEIMYKAMLDGNYKEVYSALGGSKKALYDPRKNVTYLTMNQAAEAYKVSKTTMSINYLRYGLKRVII